MTEEEKKAAAEAEARAKAEADAKAKAEPEGKKPDEPAAPAKPTQSTPTGDDPRWLSKRLKAKEKATREAVARELGYDSFEAMQKGARKGGSPAPQPQGTRKEPDVKAGAPLPSDPKAAQQITSLRSRVQFLEREKSRLEEEISAVRTDAVIETAAVRAGITSPEAQKLFTVLFAEEVEKHPEIFDNIAQEKLAEQALGFAKSLKDQHGGLFEVRSPGLSTAPPAGTPKPAEPQGETVDDTKLTPKQFAEKIREAERGIPV